MKVTIYITGQINGNSHLATSINGAKEVTRTMFNGYALKFETKREKRKFCALTKTPNPFPGEPGARGVPSRFRLFIDKPSRKPVELDHSVHHRGCRYPDPSFGMRPLFHLVPFFCLWPSTDRIPPIALGLRRRGGSIRRSFAHRIFLSKTVHSNGYGVDYPPTLRIHRLGGTQDYGHLSCQRTPHRLENAA